MHVGDGTSLKIHNVGHSCFLSPNNSSLLSLNSLLHVLAITKNLMSVSKFAKDNNVFFEFHSNSCFVKDHTSKNIILSGTFNQGLYVFDSTQFDLKSSHLVSNAAAFRIISPSSLVPTVNVSFCSNN